MVSGDDCVSPLQSQLPRWRRAFSETHRPQRRMRPWPGRSPALRLAFPKPGIRGAVLIAVDETPTKASEDAVRAFAKEHGMAHAVASALARRDGRA